MNAAVRPVSPQSTLASARIMVAPIFIPFEVQRMSIASMTGFAREAGVTGPYQWAWEIKTVNGRGLEVRVRTPSGLDAVGEEARGQILKALTRGQGQLNLSLSTVLLRAEAARQPGCAAIAPVRPRRSRSCRTT